MTVNTYHLSWDSVSVEGEYCCLIPECPLLPNNLCCLSPPTHRMLVMVFLLADSLEPGIKLPGNRTNSVHSFLSYQGHPKANKSVCCAVNHAVFQTTTLQDPFGMMMWPSIAAQVRHLPTILLSFFLLCLPVSAYVLAMQATESLSILPLIQGGFAEDVHKHGHTLCS
jgi:hypothetical protein